MWREITQGVRGAGCHSLENAEVGRKSRGDWSQSVVRLGFSKDILMILDGLLRQRLSSHSS